MVGSRGMEYESSIWRAKVRRTGVASVDVQATPGRLIWIRCRFRSTTCKRAPVPSAELKARHSNGNIRGRQVSAWHYIKVPSSPQLREPLSGNAATAALPKPALSTTALQRQNRPQAHHQHCYSTRMPLQEPTCSRSPRPRAR